MPRTFENGREKSSAYTVNLRNSFIEKLREGKRQGIPARLTIENALGMYWALNTTEPAPDVPWKPVVADPKCIEDLGPEPKYSVNPKGWLAFNQARAIIQVRYHQEEGIKNRRKAEAKRKALEPHIKKELALLQAVTTEKECYEQLQNKWLPDWKREALRRRAREIQVDMWAKQRQQKVTSWQPVEV